MAGDDAPAPSNGETPDFEKALEELEGLVERMETGELPLEESLKAFERGITLTRHCQESLKAAEQKVEILTRGEDGSETTTPFQPDQGPESP